MIEGFESRPHKAVSFVVVRDKELQGWNEQKMPDALHGCSGGRLPGRSTKGRSSEEEEAEEECRERQVRNAIVQEMVWGIKKKARAQVDAKQTAQRTVWQSVKQNWDCSQVENEEEDEDWQEGDQMEMQWMKNG